MSDCARSCTQWRKHVDDCPARDGQPGAWITPELDEAETTRLRALDEEDLAAEGYSLSRYGAIQTWHPCDGCKPRPATNGALCESCVLRLADMLAVSRVKVGDSTFLEPGTGSIAWAFGRIGGFLEPSQQAAGDKVGGSKTPPAPVALGNLDLRDALAEFLGRWLTDACGTRNLRGPDWWRRQQDETRRRRDARPDSWRPLLPRTMLEVVSAQAFLSGWVGELIRDAERAVRLYSEASDLLARVKRVAPWQAERRRLPGLTCPSCERDALVIEDGRDSLECRRCKEVVKRDRYDRWGELIRFEREEALA